MSGWIKLHRKVRDNPVLERNPIALAFFVSLLLEASYEPRRVYFGGKPIDLERGQAALSLSSFAVDVVGCTRQQSRTIVAKLVNEGMINLTGLPTNAGQIVTICKYDIYQRDELVGNQGSNQPSTNQQPTSIKKGKKEKNLSPPSERFDEWWAAYPRKVAKPAAAKAYAAKVKAGANPDAMLTGLRKAIAQWDRDRTEAQFIPHPATWLNGERWQDATERAAPRVHSLDGLWA